jgi:hypothetical protein
MGCHTTAEEAANQIYAINQSEETLKLVLELLIQKNGLWIK